MLEYHAMAGRMKMLQTQLLRELVKLTRELLTSFQILISKSLLQGNREIILRHIRQFVQIWSLLRIAFAKDIQHEWIRRTKILNMGIKP